MPCNVPLPAPGKETRKEIASILAAGCLRMARERAEPARTPVGDGDLPESPQNGGTGQNPP